MILAVTSACELFQTYSLSKIEVMKYNKYTIWKHCLLQKDNMSLFYRTLLPIFCLCYMMNKRHIQFPFHYRKIHISFYIFGMVKRHLCIIFIRLFESINCQKSLTVYFVLHNEVGKKCKLYDNWFYVRCVIGLYLWL